MMRRSKAGMGKVFLDQAGFVFTSLLFYLIMLSARPLDVDHDSLLGYAFRLVPSLQPWSHAFVMASVWPLVLMGSWIKRWAPTLPISDIRNHLVACFLLMWSGPIPDLFDDGFTLARVPKYFWILAVSCLLLLLCFRMLATVVETGEEGLPEVPETHKAVGFWYLGWTFYFATFAALTMKVLVFDLRNAPPILAGIALAYWSFRMVVKVRKLGGQDHRGWLTWGGIVAGLWAFCTAALWMVLEVWG